MRLLVIADDLSGAADCAVASAEAGLSTAVVLGEAVDVDDLAVVAVDSDTRAGPRHTAGATVGRIAARLLPAGSPAPWLYKKLDSTLRGHWPEEIAALHAARPGTRVVLAPAFPALGRTVVDGRPFLHGEPLEGTEIGRAEGLSDAALATLLRRAALPCRSFDRAAVRGGALAGAFAACADPILVCDTETEEDLAAIARAAASLGPAAIWAGSAGLARHLSAACGLAGSAQPREVPRVTMPVLVVVGSASGVSREQVARLGREPGVASVTVSPFAPGSTVDDAARAIAAALARGDDVAVRLPDNAEGASGAALAPALGHLLAPFADAVDGLVCTGGETARAVLTAFGERRLDLVGAVEPGVALSVTAGRLRLPVITKAGAFGRPDTLIRCRAALRAPHLTPALEPSP